MSSNLPERPPSGSAQPRRARHLMDPNALPQRPATYDDASVRRVQRWVMSALVVVVAMLLAVGWVAIAGTMVHKTPGKWVLLANSAAFGVAGLVGARVIHLKGWLSPWLLLGLVPAVAGGFWVLR
ncbi:hypothetical protein GCM10011584_06100 [Nocardioides phosphati]|uniref:Uncharacterized protein n=1 Tax=Nocardioides phosphati TaxID=1867775 RepID=A0ABQ2N5U2_9ACTN|nr:hypothetical protein [Nocardioides phosphati]GGO85649.1 hypothetical protein GCM10011584_06100 [Nocardioides phosphati]